MRISTPQFNYNSMEGVRKHAEDLYSVQAKLSSGQRVMTPGDDPVAAARIYRIQSTMKQIEQYNSNGDFAKQRLNLEDASLSDFTDVLQRIRELSILGMSDTQNLNGRQAVAAEMSGLLENLKSIANTQDSNGEFIMSGDKSNTAPYQQVTLANVTTLSTGSGTTLGAPTVGVTAPPALVGNTTTPVAYFTVVPTSGTAVSIKTMDGNTVNVTTTSANQVVDNFNGKVYTLNTATNGYEDANGQPLYAYFGANVGSRYLQIAPDDDNIDPNNDRGDPSRIRISDNGARAFGSYSQTSSTPWAPAYSQTGNPQMNYNIFDTVREMINQLNTGSTGTPAIASNVTKMDELVAELDTTMKSVSNTRTEVGARLQRVDMQNSMNQDFKLGLTDNLSKLRDQDMVSGISDYQKILSGLQMSQLTYSKISELSLFNYIR